MVSRWRHRFLQVAGLFTGIILCQLAAAQQTAVIVYVRTGNTSVDQSSVAALQATVNNLNSGAEGFYTYTLKPVDKFTEAEAIAASGGYNQTNLAAHGVFDSNGNYDGMLTDTSPTDSPASEVDGHFANSFHCGMNGKSDGFITNDDIGHALANSNGGSYNDTAKSQKFDDQKIDDDIENDDEYDGSGDSGDGGDSGDSGTPGGSGESGGSGGDTGSGHSGYTGDSQ